MWVSCVIVWVWVRLGWPLSSGMSRHLGPVCRLICVHVLFEIYAETAKGGDQVQKCDESNEILMTVITMLKELACETDLSM